MERTGSREVGIKVRLATNRDWPLTALTAREIEILGLVAQGAGNREIAGNLGISLQTVKNHLGNVFLKLGVNNRSAAVRVGLGARSVGIKAS